jgi:hypothetical protein
LIVWAALEKALRGLLEPVEDIDSRLTYVYLQPDRDEHAKALSSGVEQPGHQPERGTP